MNEPKDRKQQEEQLKTLKNKVKDPAIAKAIEKKLKQADKPFNK